MVSEGLVGIVLLNYNSYADTVACIASIVSNGFSKFHLCVVDNFSSVEEQKRLSTFFETFNEDPRFSLILNDENLGFSGGNNVGIKHLDQTAKPSFFWILNNDTIVDPHALGYLVAFAQENTNYKLIGNTLVYYDRPEILQGIGGRYHKWLGKVDHVGAEVHMKDIKDLDVNQVHYPIGASLFVKREYVETVGLLPDDHFLFFEEIDYVKRGERYYQNFIGICKEAIVLHKEGASYKDQNQKKERSKIADFYFIKNRLKITRKYFPEATITVYASVLFVIFNRLRRRQFDRVGMILAVLCGAKRP